MPSHYTPKSWMADYYEVVMPFGTFRLARNEQEGDNAEFEPNNEHAVLHGQRITRDQMDQVFAAHARLQDIDGERVRAANAQRDAQLRERTESAIARRQFAAEQHSANSLERARRKRIQLEAKILRLKGELAAAELELMGV